MEGLQKSGVEVEGKPAETAKVCARCETNPAVGTTTWCANCTYNYSLWRYYRLTRTEYEDLRVAQRNRCAICREPFGDARPHVDHRHDCTHRTFRRPPAGGTHAFCCKSCVRGLLCQSCNHLVGYIEKRRHLLERVFAYIDAAP